MGWARRTWSSRIIGLGSIEAPSDHHSCARARRDPQGGLETTCRSIAQRSPMILHTDSARSYKAKVRGVLHDSVVHQKKRVKVRGKFVWKSPNFVKLVTHKLPCGKKLRVKAGTQIIDRTWRFIKDRLRLNQFTKVGSSLLRAQIRSAQYE